jgi:hypothetical protein
LRAIICGIHGRGVEQVGKLDFIVNNFLILNNAQSSSYSKIGHESIADKYTYDSDPCGEKEL